MITTGDKVKFKEDEQDFEQAYWRSRGCVYEVKGIDEDGDCMVYTKDKTRYYFANPRRLEKVSVFKVGDKVKLISNTMESVNNVGDIGTITSLDKDDGTCRVDCGLGTDCDWSSFSDLEKVNDMENKLVIDGKEIKLSEETVANIKEVLGNPLKRSSDLKYNHIGLDKLDRALRAGVEIYAGSSYSNWSYNIRLSDDGKALTINLQNGESEEWVDAFVKVMNDE